MKSFHDMAMMLEFAPAANAPSPAQDPNVNAIPAAPGEADRMQAQAQQQQPGQAEQEASALVRQAMDRFDQYVLPKVDSIKSPEAKQQFVMFLMNRIGFQTDSQLRNATNQVGMAARSGEISTGQNMQAMQNQ
jgi:hypothetical protein